MFEVSGLSKKDIQEEYEDLVFRKVMAIYVENESKQILAEIKAEKENNNVPVDTKAIEKLYDKKERRENLSILWKYSKKVVSFAAMIVFVAIISLSSAVVTFADVRENIAKYLYYYLTFENYDEYAEIGIGEKSGFINPEIYTWDNAYALTYIPNGFVLGSFNDLGTSQYINYSQGNKVISFIQSIETTSFTDAENADSIKNVIINDSEGILILKDDWSCLSWSIGNKLLQISGTISEEEIIKMAEGVKIFK